MTKAELDTMLQEKLKGTISSELEPILKGFEDRFSALEKVEPAKIHTKGNIHDDGMIQDVGPGMFRLPGGSVINTDRMWAPVGKSGAFRRSSGVFEHLGEESEHFFVKMKEALQSTNSFKVQTKALDIGDVMRVADDSSAGLFVPNDVRYALLQFAPPGTIVWPRAQVWPMTTDNIQWPKLYQDLATAGSEEFFGNVIMTWTEEGRAKTKTRPEFGTLSLDCHEISAYTEVTDILLEDSAINIGNLLIQLFQGAYWHYTDKVFLTGFGGTRPLGVLNDPNVWTQNRVISSKVVFQDLLNMSSKLPPMFDSGAVFMMAKSVFNSLRKQVDDNGQPVIQLGDGYNNFGEGIAGYILGYPVIMSDYKTSALGVTGDVVLGNWKHYFIGERSSVKMEMSRHVAFQENRTAFRASARLGGIPEEPKAFVVLQSTADASLS